MTIAPAEATGLGLLGNVNTTEMPPYVGTLSKYVSDLREMS